MAEQENRDTIERFEEAFERRDLDALVGVLFLDDYVEEYPQSGERTRGKQNLRAIRELPGVAEPHRAQLSGDLGVMKMTLDYEGKHVYACQIVDFEDGKTGSLKLPKNPEGAAASQRPSRSRRR